MILGCLKKNFDSSVMKQVNISSKTYNIKIGKYKEERKSIIC